MPEQEKYADTNHKFMLSTEKWFTSVLQNKCLGSDCVSFSCRRAFMYETSETLMQIRLLIHVKVLILKTSGPH